MIKYVRALLLAGLFMAAFAGTVNALPTRKDIVVTDNGVTKQYMTSAKTVGDFLEAEGITIAPNDVINLSLEEEIDPVYIPKLEIKRSINIRLNADGEREIVNVPSGTSVGVFIEKMALERGKEYSCDGMLTDILKDNQALVLTSSAQKQLVSTEPIPYDTVFQPDEELEKGKIELERSGVDGEMQITAMVTHYGNGDWVSEIVSEEVIKEPVARIIRQGVKDPPAYVSVSTAGAKGSVAYGDEGDMPFGYTAKYSMNATAYTAGPESTGKSPGDAGYGVTAAGMRAQRGVVAVDPSVIALGTRLYVDGYGYAVAGDTGGAINGYAIDLFHDTVDECLQFGRRTVTVYVLDE